MTLWLPLLDFARSYAPMVQQATKLLPENPGCVSTLDLSRSQIAAFRLHSQLKLMPTNSGAKCAWLIANGENPSTTAGFVLGKPWLQRGIVSHPADRDEKVYIFERRTH